MPPKAKWSQIPGKWLKESSQEVFRNTGGGGQNNFELPETGGGLCETKKFSVLKGGGDQKSSAKLIVHVY